MSFRKNALQKEMKNPFKPYSKKSDIIDNVSAWLLKEL